MKRAKLHCRAISRIPGTAQSTIDSILNAFVSIINRLLLLQLQKPWGLVPGAEGEGEGEGEGEAEV